MVHPFFALAAVSVDIDASLVVHVLIFTAFTVLMKDLIFDPLLAVFEERERQTAGAIAEARAADAEALKYKADYDGAIEQVRREAARDREQIRARLKKLEAEMLASARTAAQHKLDAGLAAIGREVEAVRGELAGREHALAADIASRALGREVRP